MKLILLFDQRFFQSRDGTVFSGISYSYQFFADRYLPAFESVGILARVAVTGIDKPDGVLSTEGPGVKVLKLPDWTGPVGYLRHRRCVIRVLRKHLDRETAVIMITPGGIGTLLTSELLRRRHPFAVEVVGNPWEAFAPGSISHPLRILFRHTLSWILKAQCRKAAAALYVTRSALQKRYRGPAASAGISDVSLRKEAFAATPRIFSAPAVTLINVARMAQLYKGQDILIEAVACAISRGMNIRLVLVGDGALRPLLQELAVKAEVADRVTFTGALSLDNVRQELDRSDVFVLPSRTEGLPRALVEAMARGLPCVATNVGGVSELLPDDDLVPPRNAWALARKIQDVACNPERLTKMSSVNLLRAREYAESVLVPARIDFYRRFSSFSRELLSPRPKRYTTEGRSN